MRPGKTDEETAAIARRRLDLLSAELAALRGETPRQVGDDRDDAEGLPDQVREEPSTEAPESRPVTRVPGRHARRPVPVGGRVAGWLHDRLPPTLQGRVALGAGHLTVVAMVAAAALAVTAWWVLRADGTTTVVAPAAPAAPTESASAVAVGAEPLATPAGTTAGTAVSGSGSASSAETMIVVDVAGKVRRPGIVRLPQGSRVVDAIDEAGGARRGVDLTGLNLARVLADGEQVVVGIAPPGGVAASAASAGGGRGAAPPALVNVNTATAVQLEDLPGVGPVTAAAIIDWRSEHGAFTAVDELLEVSGIGETTLSEIAPHVTL